jgi:hypothetical protein
LHLAHPGARVLRISKIRVFSDLPSVLAHLVDLCKREQRAMELERESSLPAPALRCSLNASEKDPPFPRNRGKGAGG